MEINYDEILDAIINDDSYYEDVYAKTGVVRNNLLDYPIYQELDNVISSILYQVNEKYKSATTEEEKNRFYCTCWEQDEESEKYTFRHISLLRNFEDENTTNKIRIYLSPTDENLYPLIQEIIKYSLVNKVPIYFKYSRENRLDKLLFYVDTKENYSKIIEMLKEIKNQIPNLFSNMGNCIYWMGKTDIDGVYYAPELNAINFNGQKFKSYGMMMSKIFSDISQLLYFSISEFDDPSNKPLLKYDRNILLSLVKKYLDYYLTKYKIFDDDSLENDKIITFDDYILLDRNEKKLIVGQRLNDDYIYEFCEVPLGMPLPSRNNYKNSGYTYYQKTIFDQINAAIKNGNHY